MADNNKKVLNRVNETISKLTDKDFTLYFFVIDSKNIPNGSTQYSYQIAKTLFDLGYKVKMVYQIENELTPKAIKKLEKEGKVVPEEMVFTGVGDWLGEEYMKIPHLNIATSEWRISPADFLFIPEAFSSLMKQTYQYKAPCKRIVLLHNFDYVTDFIPFNDEWITYGINDAVVNTESQSELVKSVFPYVKTNILPPYIEECFRKPVKQKKLAINIVSKKTDDVNKVIKQFYWKYPMYRFITFRDLRNYSKEKYAEYLKETPITIWIDDETPFGYSALEAMRCGNIVVGKVPQRIPEWMGDEDGLFDNGVWTYNINSIPDILAKVIGSWMRDEVPNVIYENIEKLNDLYTKEQWNKNVDDMITNFIKERITEINFFKDSIIEKTETE